MCHAQALVSHVLTGPLTLFTALQTLIQQSSPKNPVVPNDVNSPSTIIRLCCIGARSEAQLPLEYWRELLTLLVEYQQYHHHHQQQQQQHNNGSVVLQFDICGPEMDSRRPNVTLIHHEDSSSRLTLRWMYTGKFHDYWHQLKEKEPYDVYVLFNPGVGHSYLQDDWRPTLDLLLTPHYVTPQVDSFTTAVTKNAGAILETNGTTPSMVLLTAHSALDAARDATYLRRQYQLEEVEYHPNPFASRISYVDPLQPDHLVHPNHHVAFIMTAKSDAKMYTP
jgi:hypothetical protein